MSEGTIDVGNASLQFKLSGLPEIITVIKYK